MLSRQLHPGGGTHPQKLPDGGWGHRGVDHPGLGWRMGPPWSGSSRPWMEDGATVEWIIQALDGGWGHRGVDHPGLGGICKEGGPHLSNRRGRHSGPSPCGYFWRSTGPLCSPHLVPWPVAESVVGYAQHLLLLTTKLSTAKAESINPAMLFDRFIEGLQPHPSVATFVTIPGSRKTSPSIMHGLKVCAGCARMLMWRSEQSRSWWLNPSTTRKWNSCEPK